MYQLLTNTLSNSVPTDLSKVGIEMLIVKMIFILSAISIAPSLIKYSLIKKVTPVKGGKVKKERQKFLSEMTGKEFTKEWIRCEEAVAQDEFYESFRRKYDGWLGKYFTEYAYRYCQQPYVWGYMGHEFRTKETDILLTTVVSNAKTKYNEEVKTQLFGMWLCSRYARHFMDRYDGNDILFVREAKRNLNQWLASMEEFYKEPTIQSADNKKHSNLRIIK